MVYFSIEITGEFYSDAWPHDEPSDAAKSQQKQVRIMSLTKPNLRELFVIFILSCSGVFAQDVARPIEQPIRIGRPDAPFKLEVFYDLQCPSCGDFHPKLKAAFEKYPDKMFITFRHFPLMMHDKSFMASMAVAAAQQQGKGYEMMNTLLSNQSEWSNTTKYRDMIFIYAAKLGMDVPKFRKDWFGSQLIGHVITDMERAKSMGVNWTPCVFLNGKELNYSDALGIENIISNGN
jgi:protein-disulfide isomerase